MKNQVWCHSRDGEEYYGSFDTREEAIIDAESTYCDGYTKQFYIGVGKVAFIPSIDVDNVLETLSEQAYDEGGEYGEDYLDDVSDEDAEKLSDKLNEVFRQWAKETGNEPEFYTIVKQELIDLTSGEHRNGKVK